jgi:hypothetical protein
VSVIRKPLLSKTGVFFVKVTADNSHDRAVEIKILFQANKIDVLTTALIWTDLCGQLEYRPSVAV